MDLPTFVLLAQAVFLLELLHLYYLYTSTQGQIVKGQRRRVTKWLQVQSKLTFARRGSACRYDCTFLWLIDYLANSVSWAESCNYPAVLEL